MDTIFIAILPRISTSHFIHDIPASSWNIFAFKMEMLKSKIEPLGEGEGDTFRQKGLWADIKYEILQSSTTRGHLFWAYLEEEPTANTIGWIFAHRLLRMVKGVPIPEAIARLNAAILLRYRCRNKNVGRSRTGLCGVDSEKAIQNYYEKAYAYEDVRLPDLEELKRFRLKWGKSGMLEKGMPETATPPRFEDDETSLLARPNPPTPSRSNRRKKPTPTNHEIGEASTSRTNKTASGFNNSRGVERTNAATINSNHSVRRQTSYSPSKRRRIGLGPFHENNDGGPKYIDLTTTSDVDSKDGIEGIDHTPNRTAGLSALESILKSSPVTHLPLSSRGGAASTSTVSGYLPPHRTLKSSASKESLSQPPTLNPSPNHQSPDKT